MFGWLKKKGTEIQPMPSVEKESERYQGKPLLILLENWILHTIGELEQSKVATMRTTVQRVYGGGENWNETLRNVLHLEDEIEDVFRKLWQRNQRLLHKTGLNCTQFNSPR